jgi:hypothetical protein
VFHNHLAKCAHRLRVPDRADELLTIRIQACYDTRAVQRHLNLITVLPSSYERHRSALNMLQCGTLWYLERFSASVCPGEKSDNNPRLTPHRHECFESVGYASVQRSVVLQHRRAHGRRYEGEALVAEPRATVALAEMEKAWGLGNCQH